MPTIALRPSTPADADFYYRLVDETLRSHIVYAWGSFDEARARADANEFGRSQDGRVIEVDGTPSGILLFGIKPDHLYVHLLCLLPSAQRIGIGTLAMRHVLARAVAANIPVRLRVITSNPVKPFYDRLGFRVIEETGKYRIMEYVA